MGFGAGGAARVTRLRAAAGIVFALDLLVLALMVRDLMVADFDPTGRAFATVLTEAMGAWLAFVGIILVASWWRSSRCGMWIALVCGAPPLLWVWSVIVQEITEWAAARR